MDIAYQRLQNQHLWRPLSGKPEDVVRRLVAVQAQDFAGAKWALGLRLQGATDAAIEDAFTEGSILRTHLLRPTWHFVTPADIRWILALTAPRVHAVNASMYRKLELDRAILKRSKAVLAKALQGNNQLTRDELRGALRKAGIATEGEFRMGYIMMAAELDGIVCSGGRRGKQFTYALLDERAPHARTLEGDEALAELARRYFISRGPATLADFAKWSGLTITDAKRGLDFVRTQLLQEVVDGQTSWFSKPEPSVKAVSPTAYLLSIYDEYISGYKDHSAIGDERHLAQLKALGNALNSIVVVDGQVIGTWKRTLKRSTVIIETNPFAPLTRAENRAVALAAEQYGSFLGKTVVMI